MSKFLFVMPEIGYLRLYETTVRALASRGHQVHLAFDNLGKGSRNQDALADAPSGLSVIGAVPPLGPPWRDALIELGCTIDYIRFLSVRDGTPYLRRRMDKYLPPRAAGLRRAGRWPVWFVTVLAKAAALAERAVPADAGLLRFLRTEAPDAVVVTPVVLRGPSGAQQTGLVKASRVLGLPVALAVGSWDHLSSKGLIRVDPDMVLVWNDIQRREAMDMHGVSASRIRVTGAQAFDQWFERTPTLDRTTFLQRVGLPVDRPVILFAGSSRGISNPAVEVPFVRRWLEHIRQAPSDVVRRASVLVRPHTSNVDAWVGQDLSAFGAVSIWPRRRPSLPMNELETSDYFHSLFHSHVVVGINTSAMIEATIIGRPVLTIETEEFADSQRGTRHFRYLLPEGGGAVRSARTFEIHVVHLGAAIEHPEHTQEERRRFVESFVRPRGLEREALDAVVDALEALPSVRHTPQADGAAWLAPLRWGLRALTRQVPEG